MEENLHDGHRERMRKRFLESNLPLETPPHEILEMLLFYSIPRKNTNEIAHNLMKKFGSFTGVCNAAPEELMKVDGVSKNTAVLIKLMPAAFHAHRADLANKTREFSSVEDVGVYLLNRYAGIVEEQFSMISLDSGGRFISFDIVAVGDISSVGVSIRKIMKILMRTGATVVVLAHNHPGGIALPSAADLTVTKSIGEALKPIGVHLADHIILVEDDFVSLAQTERFSELFE